MPEASRKSSLLLLLGSVFSFVWLTWLFTDPHHRPDFSDFQVYHLAGIKAFHHQTVYDVAGHYQYKYAPFVAAVFGVTLSQWPAPMAGWIFYFGTLALWIGLVAWVWRWVKPEATRALLSPLVPGILFALFYGMGLRDELKLGQINVLPLGCLALFFHGVDRKRSPALLGFLLSLAVQIKLYCVLVAPLLLFRKQYRVLIWTAAATLLTNGLILALYHGLEFAWSENLAWLKSLSMSSQELLFSVYNVSLLGMLGKWLGLGRMTLQESGLRTLCTGIWAAAVGAFLLSLWRRRSAPALFHFGWIFSMVTILNPLSWPYWMLLTFPAAFAWVRKKWEEEGVRASLALGCLALFFFVVANLQNDRWGHRGLTLIGNVLVAALFYQAFTKKLSVHPGR